jgi:hypothetical protein
MKRSFFILFLIVIVGFAFGQSVLAQAEAVYSSDFDVEMIPANPGPNQYVRVSIVSYNTDINGANVAWSINGKVQKTGIGEKQFNFTTGAVNTTTTLGIKVVTAEGETIIKSIPIKPVAVDLLWQAESVTPPFYKGKALFSHQSKITFIAIPHMTNGSGVEISPKNLIYKWTRNGTVKEDDSGYGKNTYSENAPLISRPIEMSVEVTSQTNNAVGFGNITANPIDPTVVFYRRNPIYGIEFEKALSGMVEMTNTNEVSVVALPIFFAKNSRNYSDLTYKWAINGAGIGNDQSLSEQVFRPKEGTSGTSNISLSVENSDKILQFGKGSFNLNFGGSSSQ